MLSGGNLKVPLEEMNVQRSHYKRHGPSYPFCVQAVSHNAIMLMSAVVGGGCTASKILQEQTCHFAEGMLHWNYAYEYNKWQCVSTLLPLRSRLISKVRASTEPVWPWSTRHEDTYNNRQREVGQQAQRQQVGQVQRESESALALCTCLKGHTIPLQGTHSSVKVSQR